MFLERMKAPALRNETVEEIRQIAGERGCELIAVETAGAGRQLVVRVVLDREGGVTLEDCEKVSRDVSPLLDAEAEISHSYHLEVSSPGLDRKLYSVEDAARFLGRAVRVKTAVPVEGSRNLAGKLVLAEDGHLVIV